MTTTTQTGLAQALEQVLPVGASLIHTKTRWWWRRWDSWTEMRDGRAVGRTGWRDVDSDKSLAVLLDRLGREGGQE